MKEICILNCRQKRLVEENLAVIHWAIHNAIKVNEHIYGFEYDDLYGEGCVWLCRAAATYDEKRGCFAAYAQTVVKNGLLSYCRIMCSKQSRQRLLLDISDYDNDRLAYIKQQMEGHETGDLDRFISLHDALLLLQQVKPNYTGTVRLGIEALELKIKGFEGKDIANLYGVTPNNVGAWISRAASRLREDKRVLDWCS